MELVRIVEVSSTNGMVVLPVFYNVDPRDVRNQTGDFGIAFKSLISSISEDEYTEIPTKVYQHKKWTWIRALQEVGRIKGVNIKSG
jgi:peptide methionine sulfoxide reductase MsrA